MRACFVYFYLPVTHISVFGRGRHDNVLFVNTLRPLTTVNFVVMHKTMYLYGAGPLLLHCSPQLGPPFLLCSFVRTKRPTRIVFQIIIFYVSKARAVNREHVLFSLEQITK